MGGEKLKSRRPGVGFFLAVFLNISGLLFFSQPLWAQAVDSAAPGQGQSAASLPASDESAMFLGEPAAAPMAAGTSSILVVLRMVLVLALAALAIYGVVFFIKRLARPREFRDPHLKVLARVSLGNESFAAVVSVGARAWLVGGSSGGVSLISEIDDAESLETMLLDDARKSAEAAERRLFDFRSLLSKMGGSSQTGAGAPGSADNLRKQRERLKGL